MPNYEVDPICAKKIGYTQELSKNERDIAVVCNDECQFLRNSLISADGKLNKEKLIKHFEQRYHEIEEIRVSVRNSVEFCMNLSKNYFCQLIFGKI